MNPRIHHVCGFLFSPDRTQVVLIEKLKPANQAGKINGVGGLVEPEKDGRVGEWQTPPPHVLLHAMAREFEEEAGLTPDEQGEWRNFARLDYKLPDGEGSVHFFEAVSADLHRVRSITSEYILIHRVSMIGFGTLPLLPTVRWLIPLACDLSKAYSVITHQ